MINSRTNRFVGLPRCAGSGVAMLIAAVFVSACGEMQLGSGEPEIIEAQESSVAESDLSSESVESPSVDGDSEADTETDASSSGSESQAAAGGASEAGVEVAADLAAMIDDVVELEMLALGGDPDALATLEAEAPEGFLASLQQDTAWVEATQGTQYEISTRVIEPNVTSTVLSDDGSVTVYDCAEVTDEQLQFASAKDGSPSMAFETREYTFVEEGDDWALVEYVRVNDGILGRDGCIPPDHAERIEGVLMEFLELNLATQKDPDAVVGPELEALTGEPLDELLVRQYGATRDVFLISDEQYKVNARRVDNNLTWLQPIPGGFIFEVDACTFMPEGKVHEQVGSGDTKPDRSFEVGVKWRGGWLIQSVPDGAGGWTDTVFNGTDLDMPSDCWERDEFND